MSNIWWCTTQQLCSRLAAGFSLRVSKFSIDIVYAKLGNVLVRWQNFAKKKNIFVKLVLPWKPFTSLDSNPDAKLPGQ